MIETSTIAAFRSQLGDWLKLNPPRDSVKVASGNRVILATRQNVRDENQDRVIYAELQTKQVDRRFVLAGIFDGIGGMLDGGKCAELAIVHLLSHLLTIRRSKGRISLIEALNSANTDLWSQYRGQGGTTFAGLFFENNRQTAVNVGDSRVYSFEATSGLRRHSVDDKIGNQLAKMAGLEYADINPEIAERLGQYLGMHGQLRPNVFSLPPQRGKSGHRLFLLSTDGVHSISDGQIEEILRNPSNLTSTASNLLDAGQAASSDNGTIALLDPPVFDLPTDQSFDCVRIWTTEGCFNFSFPTPSISKRFIPPSTPKNISIVPPTPNPEIKSCFEDAREEVEEEEGDELEEQEGPKKGRRGKPEVKIEQLTFDQIPEDESSN